MSVTRKHSGPRMSQIVVHGNTVYLAGQVAQEALEYEGDDEGQEDYEEYLQHPGLESRGLHQVLDRFQKFHVRYYAASRRRRVTPGGN